MKKTIYIPDIECDSCVKVLQRRFKSLQGIESVEYRNDSVVVVYDESLLKLQNIIQAVKNAGFRAATEPFDRKTLHERLRDMKENKGKYTIEIRGLVYTLVAFMVLVLLQTIAYFGFLKSPTFLSTYGWWFFYLNVSIVTLVTAVWHLYSYRSKITCMVGMMIAMTLGMQTGMMIGAIIGATNGFFIGSVVGTLFGVAIGAATGRCCGVMGVMEGTMAGLMGGTMGPMITVMMFSDNVLWFMPLYFAVNVAILAGFSYMLFEEVVEHKKVKVVDIDFVTYTSACIVIMGVLSLVILYAPKSVLLG